MRLFIVISLFFSYLLALDITPSNYHGKVKFIKQIELNTKFSGYAFAEISDLAYDKDRGILYMISDKGILYKFRANFSPTDFTLEPLEATYFKDKHKKRLRRWKRDTEGIALDSNGRIYVSREGKPKVTLFSKDGVKIKNLKLPKGLRELSKRNLRSRNKSLESLAYHPQYGLLTALEWPPKGVKSIYNQTIYALNGKKWHFKMEPYKKNGISEIEVMSDGNLLVLERAYNGLFGKFVVTLKKVYINNCKDRFCKSEVLLSIDSAKGWTIENFEGLARVGKNRYLMISDDNSNFFQQTLLLYFEITN